MAREQRNSVIHRMAQVAREDFDARAMSASKALRLALSRVAERLFGLAVTVSTVEQVTLAQSTIRDGLGDDGLLLLLDGDDGQRGALQLDRQFLASLIEVQTMGEVRSGEAPSRVLTRTDAAIAAPLVDGLLQAFDEQMTEGIPGHVPLGMRFGDMIEDARTLALTLDKPDYDLFRITADLGIGARTGVLNVLLPRLQPPARTETGASSGATDGAVTLENSALGAPVMLNAVMARLSMPLDRICALVRGQILTIPREAISDSQLLGAGNHLVAPVKLGQVNGWRAVRMLGPEATSGACQPLKNIEKSVRYAEGEEAGLRTPNGIAAESPKDATSLLSAGRQTEGQAAHSQRRAQPVGESG